jgi:hypothetical protein
MKNKSSIYHRTGNYAKRVLADVVHFFKVRWHAKPFDIWKECQDDNRKKDACFMADYISYDGKLYYGHPLGIFIESSQNSWWLSRNSR